MSILPCDELSGKRQSCYEGNVALFSCLITLMLPSIGNTTEADMTVVEPVIAGSKKAAQVHHEMGEAYRQLAETLRERPDDDKALREGGRSCRRAGTSIRATLRGDLQDRDEDARRRACKTQLRNTVHSGQSPRGHGPGTSL